SRLALTFSAFFDGIACMFGLVDRCFAAVHGSLTSRARSLMFQPFIRVRRGLGRGRARFVAGLAFALVVGAAEAQTIRVGHFPNITHVQGLVAHHLTRQGKGWLEQRLGPGAKIEWFVYNAGPSATEAMFANSIDLAYVGPNPAINAYVKSGGTDIRI